MNKKVYISKSFSFEASHYLPEHKGKCNNLHGHSYKLIVTIYGNIDSKTGMVIDFSDLKDITKKNIIDKFDHTLLNDYFDNPTAEIMAVDIFDTIDSLLPENCNIYKVKLFETENSFVEYLGE